jgi:ATP-dependent DNA ligase
MKWDGMRTLAYLDAGGLRLRSRSRTEVAVRTPFGVVTSPDLLT